MAKARKPWSKVSLHRHLLNLLDRPTTTLKLRAKRNDYAGDATFDDYFPPAKITIELDGNNQPLARYVMHELLHVILCEIILGKFDETVEEAFILGLENFMWAYIEEKKGGRRAKWDALIERKLAETAATEPNRPLLELADRPPEK